MQIDTNQDGFVSYEEFIPVGVEIMIEIIKDKIIDGTVPHEVSASWWAVLLFAGLVCFVSTLSSAAHEQLAHPFMMSDPVTLLEAVQ